VSISKGKTYRGTPNFEISVKPLLRTNGKNVSREGGRASLARRRNRAKRRNRPSLSPLKGNLETRSRDELALRV